jgi:tetratricopeptide (TPR) repeat protein
MVGKTEEAIESMCLSGLYHPAGPAAEGLAEYFLGQRSLKEAERWVNLALKADPEKRTAKELLGDVENQKGNTKKAREILLDTLLLTGDEIQKMQMTARKLAHDASLARRGGDLPRAERELRRAALLAPENAVIAADLGDILLRRGESDAAIAWANQALKVDPNYSVAMLLGGRANSAKGDKTEARRFYEMVPIGDPFHKQAQNLRSRL